MDEEDERTPEKPVHPVEFVAVVALLLAIETALALELYRGADPGLLALLHLAATGVAAAWCWGLRRRQREWALPALIVIGTGFFGPLAPLCGLLTFPLFWVFRRGAEPFDVWFASLYPDDPYSAAVNAHREVMSQGGPTATGEPTAPFVDILRHGTSEQKIAMIALLARKFHPAFGPVLIQALADPVPAIRVQAATAVNKIEREFLARMARHERRAAARPQDPAAQRALARQYDDYAFAGILTAEREAELRRRALDTWLRYNSLVPGDEDAWLAIGRLLMRLEQYDVAARWFEDAIEDGRASEDIRLWYLECLYELGRTEELRAHARRILADIENSEEVPADVVDAVRLWAGAGPSEAARVEAAR